MRITYEPEASAKDIQVLADGLSRYAKTQKNLPPFEYFSFFIRDEHNKIHGGCSGLLYYGCIYISHLWIDETLRAEGYGSQLIEASEALGREKNCRFITVDTMDWEALEFYQNLGYKIEHKRSGYLNDSTLYLLHKTL